MSKNPQDGIRILNTYITHFCYRMCVYTVHSHNSYSRIVYVFTVCDEVEKEKNEYLWVLNHIWLWCWECNARIRSNTKRLWKKTVNFFSNFFSSFSNFSFGFFFLIFFLLGFLSLFPFCSLFDRRAFVCVVYTFSFTCDLIQHYLIPLEVSNIITLSNFNKSFLFLLCLIYFSNVVRFFFYFFCFPFNHCRLIFDI